MMDFILIPDIFKVISQKVNATLSTRAQDPFPVYFDYGHYNEVTRNLTNKDGGTTSKTKKYPLIWLVMDFVEKCGEIVNGYCELPDVQILIATVTTPAITAPERIQKTFVPRLIPVYQELMKQIADSGHFDVTEDAIPHERILRPYWGGQDALGNGTANLFNDFIDAIQIRRLKLKVNESVCDEFKLL